MTTEKEAATMWCPFVRYTGDTDHGSWGRGGNAGNPANIDPAKGPGDYACNCIGSRCMAWRWDDTGPPETRHGYCGLAGQITRFLGGVY